MARRSWDQLAPAYRARLESRGVTRRAYEAGRSLASARGHAATPERPVEVERTSPARSKARGGVAALDDPDRYGDYLERQFPDYIRQGDPPPLRHGWVEYTDSTARRGIEYANHIGNPEYIQIWITPGGEVLTRVDRGTRRSRR